MAEAKHSGSLPLSEADPDIYKLIQQESERQIHGLELIASENFTSRAVMECLGSCLTNKYSEGLPGARYYGGNEFIDQIENICRKRALEAFRLDASVWGVNVQPYSGSPANMAVYVGLLNPHDRIMGLDLPSGGHLTHGYYTAKKKISATSIFFESLPYKVDASTGLIDYNGLLAQAETYRPRLIIAGGSAYPRDWDYKRLRQICDSVGAYLMVDMAHFSGLVASEVLTSPFEFAHVVTSTTHKSLRGPRSGIIFFRKDHPDGFEAKINFAVFPSLQGGPHNNAIAALATQFREVVTPEFKQYSQQVVANARALARALIAKGYKLVTDGTDNHLILWDLRPQKLTGNKMEILCDECHITLNKNAVFGDKSALSPGGVRVGTPALTSRGFTEADFEKVAEFLHTAVRISVDLQQALPSGAKIDEFRAAVRASAEVAVLRKEVVDFSSKFYMPGIATLGAK